MAKASKKDMYLREVEIQNLMREGKSRKEIGDALCDKWNVTAQSIEKQYDKIVKEMTEELKENREDLRSELIEKTKYLYTQALAEGKIKTAIDAVNTTAKIAGLFSEKKEENQARPQKIEIVEEDQSKSKLKLAKAENE